MIVHNNRFKEETMNDFKEKMIREIELRNLSKTTRTAYLRGMSRLVNYHSKPPEEIDIEGIKDFLFFFKNEKAAGRSTKRSPNSVNGVASAISFYYRTVLKKNLTFEIPRMKYRKHTPTVLTSEEVNSMIDGIHNVFWKAVIMTLYSAGLRQSELRALKIKDIDTKRMVLHIREAKGARDREAILSPIVLKCLRTYWRLFRYNSVSSDYLFIPTQNKYNGEFKKSLSHTAVAYIVKRASEIAKINKKVHPHCLRHSFAVHLVENGVHFRHIQYLLGHTDPKTTSRYTSVADITLVKTPELINSFSGVS